MLSRDRSGRLLVSALAVLWAASSLVAVAQVQGESRRQKDAASASIQGQRTYSSNCASCHGLDGRGGERAPSIADRQRVQRLSDSQIFRIIENGIPGTGMPAFHSLENSNIRAVVTYLRTLQGAKRTAKLPGDPNRGETIFFGKANCSTCHMVAGRGGFIASDLSGYARTHGVEQVRSAIADPSSGGGRSARLATAITRGGDKYSGRIRNEDNFSLQLQTLDGAFHFVSKSDLETLEYVPQTLMPSDYGSTLSVGELDDVISYLLNAANSAAVGPSRMVEEQE